jgi:hypothetical protein
VEYRVRSWLARFVVDLNLCPFARPLVTSDALRIVVCEAEQREAIAEAFVTELALISRASESDIATSLLVLPHALGEFDAYLDFIDDAEALLAEMGLSGVIQLASFHPRYQFEGESPDSLGNFTNRAPLSLDSLFTRRHGDYRTGNLREPRAYTTTEYRDLDAHG